jgi:hypothetical protein
MEDDMRKFILITAMVLVSATAHASDPRSLTMGPDQEPAKSTAVNQAKTVDATAAEAPKYVERPSVADTNTAQPAVQPAAQCQVAPTTTADAPRATTTDFATTERPKRRHQSTESRIISELHRHGIYW